MDQSEYTNIDVLYPRNQKIDMRKSAMIMVSDKIEELKSNKKTSEKMKMIDFLIKAEVPGIYPKDKKLNTEIDLSNYILKKDEKGNDELDSPTSVSYFNYLNGKIR